MQKTSQRWTKLFPGHVSESPKANAAIFNRVAEVIPQIKAFRLRIFTIQRFELFDIGA